MHIKPYLGEEIGRGKSGFPVNRVLLYQVITLVNFMVVRNIQEVYK